MIAWEIPQITGKILGMPKPTRTEIAPLFFHVPKCAGTWFCDAFLFPSLTHDNGSRPKRVIVKRGSQVTLNLIFEGSAAIFASDSRIIIGEAELEGFLKAQGVTRFLGGAVRAYANFPETSRQLEELASKMGKKTENIILLRPPLERAESEYYYLRDVGTWEPSYGKSNFKTFKEHVLSGACGSNWIVKKLCGKRGSDPVNQSNLKEAIQFLSLFSLVGTTEKIDDFLSEAGKRYGLRKNPGSWAHLKDNKKVENRNLVSHKEPIPEEVVRHFDGLNQYDLLLYEAIFGANGLQNEISGH